MDENSVHSFICSVLILIVNNSVFKKVGAGAAAQINGKISWHRNMGNLPYYLTNVLPIQGGGEGQVGGGGGLPPVLNAGGGGGAAFQQEEEEG